MSQVFLTRFFASFFLACGVTTAGPYDALPLRGALSDETHFQTSLGRESHRFADAGINKYRLYDFYARQAQHHLGSAQKEFKELLLPYPGLEGGRLGHWGDTNEKLSSAVLNRTREPAYHRLVSRGAEGNRYVVITHKDSQSLCLFENSSASMRKITLNALLRAPEHPFSHVVDRFGFGLNAKGRDYLVNNGAEWRGTDGKPAPVTSDGYHLYQDKVIFRRMVGGTPLLDHPSVTWHDDKAVYTRHIEWRGDAPGLEFPFPIEAQLLDHPKVEIRKAGKVWLAVVSDTTRRLTHRVTSSEKVDGISLRLADGKIWISFPTFEKGTTVQMSSWISPAADTAQPDIEPEKLLALLAGGPRYFTREMTVKGTLDADPAASGTAYEIDDIPVPSQNPYGVPMTTSGLAFSVDGTAYVCTLVGDVWKVTGLDATLDEVKWQRFASGLNSPLGMEMVHDALLVTTQHGILKLEDLNNDGEADLVRPFTKFKFPGGRLHNLERDAAGNFYLCHVSGIYRVSPDGRKVEKISGPARNPLGLGVRPDGLALSDQSEGNNSNGTCSIYESRHPESENSVAKQRRILYLPRGIDNSPGSRIFMDSARFGPLGKSLLGISYGTGRIYQIMRDPNHGSPQAALRLLPGEFSSGACRIATNPKDGQLYVVGLDGWGDFATTEGCLHRVRFTGKKELVPLSWKSFSNGISVRFNGKIDPSSLHTKQFFMQQWNYIDSLHTYGSGEYSVRSPGQLGHDRIPIKKLTLSADGRELFIQAAAILPAMCTQVYGEFKSADGVPFKLDLYATINQLPATAIRGTAPAPAKKRNLTVPYKTNNGNTYATITRFFDERRGMKVKDRPVGPVVAYRKQDLDFDWVSKNILEKNACIACHSAGQQFDFSTYETLMKAVDLKHPRKSHLYGMLESGSMPPLPMPSVAPEMKKALLEWLEMGAPK